MLSTIAPAISRRTTPRQNPITSRFTHRCRSGSSRPERVDAKRPTLRAGKDTQWRTTLYQTR